MLGCRSVVVNTWLAEDKVGMVENVENKKSRTWREGCFCRYSVKTDCGAWAQDLPIDGGGALMDKCFRLVGDSGDALASRCIQLRKGGDDDELVEVVGAAMSLLFGDVANTTVWRWGTVLQESAGAISQYSSPTGRHVKNWSVVVQTKT